MPNIRKTFTILCYAISFAIYTAILLWGVLGDHHGSFFGYGMLSFYLVLPATSFVYSLLSALMKIHLKWLYPFLFSAYGLMIPLIVFPNMFSDVWIFCIVPAFLGYGIGMLLSKKSTNSAI